jgi:hypothetical protein
MRFDNLEVISHFSKLWTIVENRNVSIKDKVIHEGTNTNKTRNNAIRENKENTQKFSNQVNQEKTSYREALIRSNYS